MNANAFAKLLKACDARIREIILMSFDGTEDEMSDEKHELLEFRRIAAYIYKKNSRFSQSVQLSKEDRMYKDAIETTAESGDSDLSEDLLRFFVSVHDKACFAACLLPSAAKSLRAWDAA